MTQPGEAISVRITRLNNVLLGDRAHGVSPALSESMNRESLLDAFYLLYNECEKEALRKHDKNIVEFVNKYRKVIGETSQLRVNAGDFQERSLIGQGYFGSVHLVVEKQTGDTYAMKKIKKSMLSTSQIKEERDIMSKRSSEWITNLQYAFQDSDFLYLVMEYLPGGDLLCLMSRHGPFDEQLTRFYLAELTLAINALHVMGYVHRDIKPENILIDRFGHIKLADFGNAAATDRDGHVSSLSPVGTPDYIAPELLQTISTHRLTKNRHDVSCDFWSMGIIGYELVCEVTPFHEDNIHETYSKILSHCEESQLVELISFPSELKLSENYRKLVECLVTKPSKRLNYEAIRKHAFFENVNWDTLRSEVPPIIPTLHGDDDTSNFDDLQSRKTKAVGAGLKKQLTAKVKSNEFCAKDLPFVGYGYVYMEEFLKPEATAVSDDVRISKLNNKLREEQFKHKVHLDEIAKLRQELLRAELKTKQSYTQSRVLDSAKEEIAKMKAIIKEKNNELVNWRSQMKTLQSSLKIEQEMWEKKEATITELLRMNRQKYEEAKQVAETRYEKRILEMKIEIDGINKKLEETEAKLCSKTEEYLHLQQKIENYQEMLKQLKEQSQKDQEEFEKNRIHLAELYEQRYAELKTKLRCEKDDKSRLTMELRQVRAELDDTLINTRSSEEGKLATAKTNDEILERLNTEIEANNELRSQNTELQRKYYDTQKTIEAMQQQINRLERELQVAECSKKLTEKYIGEEASPYETAPGSLTDIRVVEEQLRADLETAKENENSHKERADKLQDIVKKLEEMLERFSEQSFSPTKPLPAPRNGSHHTTVGDMLEKQNEKLEDKLAAVREQMIVERQSARSANLALWKTEKQLEETVSEKKMIQRRMELTEVRIKKIQAEHEEAKRLLKLSEEDSKLHEKRSNEMKQEIANLKSDIVKERRRWEQAEKERMEYKSEIINHICNYKLLQDRLSEEQQKLQQSQQKCDKLDLENKRLMSQIVDEKESLANAQDQVTAAQIELRTLKDNYDRLKYACTVTDNQLTEVETMLRKEQMCNKSNQEKLNKLYIQVRIKEELESTLEKQLREEQTLKETAESLVSSLTKKLQELEKLKEDDQNKFADQRHQLIEQTSLLFATQEKVEMLQNENQSIQVLYDNQERELLLLKEENARILSDLYHAKEEAQNLHHKLNESLALNTDLQDEVEDLRKILEEKENFYLQRDIKSEATLSQHKKLIDYLQLKVEDLTQKKKKTLADKFFGHNSSTSTNKKENAALLNVENSILYRTLQEELKREKLRCKSMQEQLARLQGKSSSSARLPLKGNENRNFAECGHSTPPSKKECQQLENKDKIFIAASPKRNLDTQAGNRSLQSHHRFELDLQESSSVFSKCVACKNPLVAGASYWRCRECKCVAHRKCKGEIKKGCDVVAATLATVDCESSPETVRTMELQPSTPVQTHLDSDSVDKYSYEGRLEEPETLCVSTDIPDCKKKFLIFRVTSGSDEKILEVACAYEIEENKILLLGCNSGLYALRISTGDLVHIAGIDDVSCMAITQPLAKAIMVGSQGESLYQIDLRHLQSRSQSYACSKPALEASVLELPFANRSSSEKWRLVQISQETQQPLDTVAIAATSSRIVILKYDINQQKFKPVRALDTATPVTSILYTRHSAVVASDKFFEIDLSTYGAEEFIDVSDQSLSHTRSYTPIVAVHISKQEFLLCFMENGIFVDEFGCRSRPYDIHWEYTPCGFLYKAPFLYVAHFQTIQIIRIHRSYSQEAESTDQKDVDADVDSATPNFKRSYLPFYMPSLLAESGKYNAFVVAIEKETALQEIYRLEALQAFRQQHNDSLNTISSVATSVTLNSLSTTSN